ncbi:MAG TPA: hypothetical protein P5247_03645, partial [Candidatus Saccharimonadales bacterium]|nr:hypothetical protein [Candidatus Saccharimonadales bacterium]
ISRPVPKKGEFATSWDYEEAVSQYHRERLEHAATKCLALSIRNNGVNSLTPNSCIAEGCGHSVSMSQLKFQPNMEIGCPLGLTASEQPVDIKDKNTNLKLSDHRPYL